MGDPSLAASYIQCLQGRPYLARSGHDKVKRIERHLHFPAWHLIPPHQWISEATLNDKEIAITINHTSASVFRTNTILELCASSVSQLPWPLELHLKTQRIYMRLPTLAQELERSAALAS